MQLQWQSPKSGSKHKETDDRLSCSNNKTKTNKQINSHGPIWSCMVTMMVMMMIMMIYPQEKRPFKPHH
jgi:hypothetical protein